MDPPGITPLKVVCKLSETRSYGLAIYHESEAAKMPEHCCNHARYSGNCFEEQDARQPGLFSKYVALFSELLGGHIVIARKGFVRVPRNEIKSPSNVRC